MNVEQQQNIDILMVSSACIMPHSEHLIRSCCHEMWSYLSAKSRVVVELNSDVSTDGDRCGQHELGYGICFSEMVVDF